MGRKLLKKVRPQIQRQFQKFYSSYQDCFTRPLTVIKPSDHELLFTAIGLTDAVTFSLSNGSLCVTVFYQNKCWDLLASFDAVPTKVSDGYYCGLSLPEYRVTFSSRSKLWTSEMFMPFLRWFSNRLVSSTYLGLYQHNGATYAELLNEPDVNANHLIQLWSIPNE